MQKVIAVSRATPRWIEIGGRPVETSIVRDPSSVPLLFGPDGPEGNRTAVHTEHVLAFSAEHYDYWTRRLGIERERWAWCHWGENLTVAGIDEHHLRVGDILRIGPSAVFEVTSPRIPCFKLSWRLGQPDTVLKQLCEDGRIGFYLRVLAPGVIGPGDTLRLESSGAEHITIAELSRLLSNPTADDVELLTRVRAMPALGRQAAEVLRLRINSIEDRRLGSVGRWQGWRRFTVKRLTMEARDVRSIVLEPEDGTPVAPYRAGQFLTVRVPVTAGAPLLRTWSLSDFADEPRSYRLSIRKSHAGRASDWMHDRLHAGMTLEARPPLGRFTLDRGGFVPIVLISAGIGVTPLLSMLKAHAARGSAAPPLCWLHSTRNSATHAFKNEVTALLRLQSGWIRQVAYTNPLAGDRIGVDFDHTGRLTAREILRVVQLNHVITLAGRKIELPGYAADYYICGPRPFEGMVRTTLLQARVSTQNIHFESFGADAHAPCEVRVQTAEVRFIRSKVTAVWHASSGKSLLELAEDAGISPQYGCRAGSCQSCEVALPAGAVLYDPQPAVMPAESRVLLCCSRPAAVRVEVDI
ncbi:MAG TPA: MOSC domain-containing protein [Steroidobacteraceae bacterium]|nr:MOSC domain-containing protein [Steroidobacteraceae bacterium]